MPYVYSSYFFMSVGWEEIFYNDKEISKFYKKN